MRIWVFMSDRRRRSLVVEEIETKILHSADLNPLTTDLGQPNSLLASKIYSTNQLANQNQSSSQSNTQQIESQSRNKIVSIYIAISIGNQSASRRNANGINTVIQNLTRKFSIDPFIKSNTDFAAGKTNFDFANLADESEKQKNFMSLKSDQIKIASVLVTFSIVWFTVEKSALLASLFASMSAWQKIDPLRILFNPNENTGSDDKTDAADRIFSKSKKSYTSESELTLQ